MRNSATIGLVVLLLSAPLSAAEAACQLAVSLSERISETRYQQRPETILTDYGTGGVAMAEMVAAQIAFDPQFIDRIFQLSMRASGAQKEAIGRGLQRFASLCGRYMPDLERKIIEKMRSSGDKDLILAYFHEENTAADPAAASLVAPLAPTASARPKLPADFLIGDRLDSVLNAPSASPLPPP
jgi:hypothetical protein